MAKKERRARKIYNNNYFIAWPRIMKIGQALLLGRK